MRQRWFGSTGRQVDAIVLEGEVSLDGALVVDDVGNHAVLRDAHAQGTPVVVRAADAAAVREALAHPEVSCVVVRNPALLELDLAELTYGAV